MLENDFVRTILLFLLIALFLWLLLKFIYDWEKDERVRVRKKTVLDEDEAEPSIVDDLTKLEGIGPKISDILNDAGIVSFSDLQSTDVKTLERLLKKAGPRFKMHNPESWPAQAELASNGEWDKLSKLQAKLSGGKK